MCVCVCVCVSERERGREENENNLINFSDQLLESTNCDMSSEAAASTASGSNFIGN